MGNILFFAPASFAQEIALTPEEAHAIEDQLSDLDGLQIDLNKATPTDLLALPGLTPDLAWRIVAFRPYAHPDDLKRVPGLSPEDIERLSPYLSTRRPPNWQGKITGRISRPTDMLNHPRHMRFYERIELALSNRVSMLFLMERDPEEPTWNDFVTGHLTLKLPHAHLVLGDMRPHFGQGLILSRHTRPVMDLSSSNPMRLTGNRTSIEYGALRGGLISTAWGPLTLTALHGRAQWDADLSGKIPQLRLSGLHNTPTSQARKGSLHEQSTGFNLYVGSQQTHLSLTALHTHLSPAYPVEASSRQISLNGQWQHALLTLFGETAITPADYASVMGAHMRFPNLRLHVLGRRYGPHFQSLHGAAFAAFDTPPNNEWGIFSGLSWRLGKHTRLEFSTDRHGRLKPQKSPLPERGERVRVSFHRRLRKNLTLRLTADSRTRTAQTTRRGLRADLSGRHRALTFAAWASQISSGSSGRATGARFAMALPAGLTTHVWTTLFSIPDYDARIYAFEPDVWGGGHLLTLSGHGRSDGLLVTWKTSFFRLSTRYSIRSDKTERSTSWAIQIDITP